MSTSRTPSPVPWRPRRGCPDDGGGRNAGISAEDQLEWATNEGRVMFSQDRDFLRLAVTVTNHAGVAYASRETPIGGIINGLMLIHGVLEPVEMVGRVEYI